MKITQILNTLDIGGLERMVVDLAVGLKNRGHSVSVICLRTYGPLQEPLEQAGIRVRALNKPEGFNFAALRTLAGWLREDGADVAHTHNPLVHHYGAMGGRLARTGAVVTTRHGLGNFPWLPKTEKIFAWSCRFTDQVVAVCETARKYFEEQNPSLAKKLAVIYNGIPLEKFTGVPPRPRGGEFVFGIVGRLVPVKDHRTLIEAFRLALPRNPNIRLEILGDGPLRAELEEFARAQDTGGRIVFRGAGLDVPRFLAGLNAFVLCSVSEGLPLTILEAMAAGLPVLGTAVGGIPELIEDAQCGWVVPPSQPAQLSEAMLRMAAHEQSQAMGARGRSRALERYSLPQMTAEYEALFERLLRQRGKTR